MTFGSLRDPPPPGIAAGLLPGKRLGAVGFAYAAIRGGPAKMPEGVDRVQLHGLSLPAGIGFTMSPFIGGLSFSRVELHDEVRRGVIFGSGVSRPPGFNARGKAAEDRRPQAPAKGATPPPFAPSGGGRRQHGIARATRPCGLAQATRPCGPARATRPCGLARTTRPHGPARATRLHGPGAGGMRARPHRHCAARGARASRINPRMFFAASGMLVPGPKIAFTPAL
jgi:hypothetical protein